MFGTFYSHTIPLQRHKFSYRLFSPTIFRTFHNKLSISNAICLQDETIFFYPHKVPNFHINRQNLACRLKKKRSMCMIINYVCQRHVHKIQTKRLIVFFCCCFNSYFQMNSLMNFWAKVTFAMCYPKHITFHRKQFIRCE